MGNTLQVGGEWRCARSVKKITVFRTVNLRFNSRYSETGFTMQSSASARFGKFDFFGHGYFSKRDPLLNAGIGWRPNPNYQVRISAQRNGVNLSTFARIGNFTASAYLKPDFENGHLNVRYYRGRKSAGIRMSWREGKLNWTAELSIPVQITFRIRRTVKEPRRKPVKIKTFEMKK